MGIKGLRKFIKTNYPLCINNISLAEFDSKHVAVDISCYIYKYKAIFQDSWLNCIIKLNCLFKKYNVHAIYVFDGKPPIEKINELKRRKEGKEKLGDNIFTLEISLNAYKENGIKDELITSLLSKLDENYNKKRLLKIKSISFNTKEKEIALIENHILKLESQVIRITPDDISNLKSLLDTFGIPYLQADEEAETLCAELVFNKMADAVLSEDSDVLAYGTSKVLYQLDVKTGICSIIEFDKLITNMEITTDKFKKFCILCGSDYNSRIPKIGPVNALKILKNDTNIDTKIDEYIPIFNRIVEIFTPKKCKIDKLDYWKNLNIDELLEYLDKKFLNYNKSDVIECWNNFLKIEFC